MTFISQNKDLITLKIPKNDSTGYVKELYKYNRDLLLFISEEIETDNDKFGSYKILVIKFKIVKSFKETNVIISTFKPCLPEKKIFTIYPINSVCI